MSGGVQYPYRRSTNKSFLDLLEEFYAASSLLKRTRAYFARWMSADSALYWDRFMVGNMRCYKP